jgi:hypothetical protein
VAELTLTFAPPSAGLATRSRAAQRSREADGGSNVHAALQRPAANRVIQPRLLVGPADDPFEREAERTAHAVTGGSSLASTSALAALPLAGHVMRFIQRAMGKGEQQTRKDDEQKKPLESKKLQKADAGPGGLFGDQAPAGIEAGITSMSGGGSSLPGGVRSAFEPRLGLDLSDVRVHTGPEAATAASALGARAFTVGQDIFFGAGQYQPSSAAGQHLIAHEVTHTIQQKPAAARLARLLPAGRTAQRVSLSDLPDSVINKLRTWLTTDFPPWDLITLIVGWDPFKGAPVKGATRDWIHAAIKLVPDGESLFDKLDKEGKVEAIAAWWDAEVAKLDLSYDKLMAVVKDAVGRLGLSDVASPFDAWNTKIKPLLQPIVTRVWNFARAVGAKVFQTVRDLVLKAVGNWAKEQKGYPLLTMVLGRDPVTNEEVKPTLKGVIYAVLDLVDGGDKIKENLEKSKTVDKAATWFKIEVGKLQLSWEGIKALFTQAWDAFKVVDLLNPKALFEKMWAIFGPTVMRLLGFLVAVGKKILELIFEGAMLIAGPIGLQIVGIVKKIGDTFNLIAKDPVAFIGHLVDAVVKGVKQFGANIWEHLKTGLIGWLTGALGGAGLVLPKVWDLRGIVDLVLQILGISWAKIRGKLVAIIGEKTMTMLETAFGFITTLVTEGPAAAWQQIVAAIGNLWDMVIGGVKDWAVSKIVTAAITKLATMFNPVGAVIQAIIAIYNTIAFFIERIRQILDFVESVVDSIANIAQGKIAAAANYVERAMARSIPVLLGFLARLIGLGDVSESIKKVITAIQEKVDKAIDKLIAWVVEKAKSLFGAKGKADSATGGAIPDVLIEGQELHTLTVKEVGGEQVFVIHSKEQQLAAFLDDIQASDGVSDKRKATFIPPARASLDKIQTQLKAVKAAKKANDAAAEKKAADAVHDAEMALAASIKDLLAGVNLKKLKEKYGLEGIVATYGTMPKPVYDQLTPDHQPQAALVTMVAELKSGGKLLFQGRGVQGIAASRANRGTAINLHVLRHYESRTYGTPVKSGVVNDLKDAVKTPGTDDVKRAAVMKVVLSELQADVAAVSAAVVPTAAIWSDIDQVFKGDTSATVDKDKDAFKKEISDRIISGEKTVVKQDLARWSA